MTPEGKVQKEVIDYLKKKRVYHFRFQAQVNLNGLPDILALYKGVFLGLELKRPDGGKPTGLQLKKLEAINENGGIGVIIDDVEQVKMLLDIIDQDEDNIKGEMSLQVLADRFKYRWAYENSKQTEK